jgi:hypothetical protein
MKKGAAKERKSLVPAERIETAILRVYQMLLLLWT